MSTTRTILTVAPYFPPHSGGLERYAYEVARRVHATAHTRIVVLTTSESDREVVEEREGMTIHRLPVQFKISNSPIALSWFRSIPRVLKEVAPDILHIHTPVPGLGDLVALLAPRRTPLLVTYHAGSMKKGRMIPDILIGVYENTVMHMLLRRAAHIVCSSDFVRSEFLSKYSYKASTITPAVDHSFFSPKKQALRGEPTLLVVGGLGRGEEHKGLDRMLHILPTLRDEIPGLQLLVAGAGERSEELQEHVRREGLHETVHFLGRLDVHGMVDAYRRATIFVHPTNNDSFPTVILEAMACSLPVVSTTVGSIEAMVEHGTTGYLVPPNDDGALISALLTLLTNLPRAEKYGVAAREKVTKAFSWDKATNGYLEVYERIAHPSPTIAHVISYYPPHPGGMEVVAEHLARGAAEKGYRVRVFTSRSGAVALPRTVRDTNLIVRRLSGFEFAHTPVMWTLPFRLLLLPQNTIVHVHVAQVYTPEIALLVARIRGFPIIAHFHLDVEPSGPLGKLFVFYKLHVLPKLLQHMDAVMVASPEQAELVAEKHKVSRERIHRIVNAVDTNFFQDRMSHTPHTPFRVLTLSRLTVQKRVDRIIEAVGRVEIPVELLIVGDGEDRQELELLAEQVAPGRVQFTGHLSHADIPKHHAWADIFVIPSDREGGMPLNVLEAMAAGLPIVSSNADGVRELVADSGVVVEDPSPEHFANVLSALYHDTDRLREMSIGSSHKAQQYTWPVALARVLSVYHAVCTARADAVSHTTAEKHAS